MAIPQSTIRSAGARTSFSKLVTLSEGRSRQQTAFLCHSHHDRDLAIALVTFLNEAGWGVYVDWADSTMPDTPTKDTALKIQNRIVEMRYLLFLATQNSTSSRWCPWEIGYADGKKGADSVLVIPTSDASGRSFGNEYLQIYSHIDADGFGRAIWKRAGESTVRSLSSL